MLTKLELGFKRQAEWGFKSKRCENRQNARFRSFQVPCEKRTKKGPLRGTAPCERPKKNSIKKTSFA